MFHILYKKVIHWAGHQHAPYFLAGVSFAESSFFPIPPDVMLVPMVLGKPLNAWQYAFISTLASVLGGILGYMIGYFAFEAFGQLIIEQLNLQHGYELVVTWFKQYGWLAVLLAGFTPIPYKLFTIAAGAVHMTIPGFLIASIIGRSMRFYLVAFLVKTLGKKLEQRFIKYVNAIGWGIIIIGLVAYVGYYVSTQ